MWPDTCTRLPAATERFEEEFELTTRQHLLLFSFVLAAFASADPAAADSKSAFVAPEDGALVVFIHNLREDRATTYVVFDMNKQCVAEVRGRQAEVIPMTPGRHTLYIYGYNNRRIDLDLVPGRTYFIRLFSIEKFATRVTDVTLVQRGTTSFKLLKTWLEGARVTLADGDRCRGKPLKERENRTQRRINEANADWKNGDKLHRFKYRLLKEDGLTAEEIGWL